MRSGVQRSKTVEALLGRDGEKTKCDRGCRSGAAVTTIPACRSGRAALAGRAASRTGHSAIALPETWAPESTGLEAGQ